MEVLSCGKIKMWTYATVRCLTRLPHYYLAQEWSCLEIYETFINLVLKTSCKGLIPLVSIIILLSTFKILSVGLAFSRKESCLLPPFCKDLLIILEWTVLLAMLCCATKQMEVWDYTCWSEFFLSGQIIWITQQKQGTRLCSEHQCLSLLGDLFPRKGEIGDKHGCNLSTAKTTVTKSPETEK